MSAWFLSGSPSVRHILPHVWLPSWYFQVLWECGRVVPGRNLTSFGVIMRNSFLWRLFSELLYQLPASQNVNSLKGMGQLCLISVLKKLAGVLERVLVKWEWKLSPIGLRRVPMHRTLSGSHLQALVKYVCVFIWSWVPGSSNIWCNLSSGAI